MAIFSNIGAAFGLAGDKPEVPDYEPVNLMDVMGDVTQANLRGLPDIKKLAAKLNQFNVDQDLATLEQLFPGAGAIIKQAGENIQSQLRGEIPEDVQRQLRQFGAEAGVAGGTGGSEFAGYRTARDLGLTSLSLTEQGLASAERWLAQARSRVPLFNAASMFMTPGMGLQNAQFNTANQWNVDWLENQIDAMPSPLEATIMQSLGQMDQLLLSATSMSMGAGMGGMGGGGGARGGYMGYPGYPGGWQSGFGQQFGGAV